MTAGELMVAQRVEAREELDFDEIFATYQERIYNCIYRLVGNAEEAHDLTQETFLRAYTGLSKIEGELKVGPWLYRIATNLCMDQLRRRKLIRWEPWDAFVSLFHPKQVARDNPEQDALRQESRDLVHRVLQELPPRYRICLVLREYNGMSCEEIGEVIGSSRSAVKSLLFRAREEFREVYERLGGTEGGAEPL
ncbi:MAG: sigma-70 family RNA polymerase sigma factor [Chloroflexota bacterium]|nr:sigma-70 family RNA polymerase sigma factor [Chloroflexota bacterium]